jgi:hypothetical protein
MYSYKDYYVWQLAPYSSSKYKDKQRNEMFMATCGLIFRLIDILSALFCNVTYVLISTVFLLSATVYWNW